MTPTEQIREAIKQDSRSQRAIALAAGLSPGCVQRFVNGSRDLRGRSLDRLAEALCLQLTTRPQPEPTEPDDLPLTKRSEGEH